LIRQARMTNDGMPGKVVGLVEELVGPVKHPVVVLLGAAYKGNVDDDRESPVYTISDILKSKGYIVRIYDPLMKKPQIFTSLSEATKDACCLVLVTDHDVFRSINPTNISNMICKKLVDTRNFLDRGTWERAGFVVGCLGR
jgi:UDP-N-acetyl-D-mannosaminuronic acid dehydrogenase